jgi:hypothetical protein
MATARVKSLEDFSVLNDLDPAAVLTSAAEFFGSGRPLGSSAALMDAMSSKKLLRAGAVWEATRGVRSTVEVEPSLEMSR